MKTLIKNFPAQLREAVAIAEKASLSPAPAELRNVLISGLGGSGIGGTIVSELLAGEADVPVTVSKDYGVPAFVGPHTLVVACSYSGNTEETLAALAAAKERKAKIVCVTSGGSMLDEARATGLDAVIIPGGMPPRACFGYSFVQLLYILRFHGVAAGSHLRDLNDAAGRLESEQEEIVKRAADLAGKLHGRIPVLYCAAGSEGAAVRFRQQINENAKMLCWHQVLPEMNHNELVGWGEKNDTLSVVFFRNEDDHRRTRKRMDVTREVIGRYTDHITEVPSRGRNRIERMLYLIHLGDWTSYFLAEKKNIDVVEVKVIDYLKGELAKF